MNPGAEIRKPLRAKKTMALSSRKQAELLDRLKAAQGAESAAGEEEPARLPAAEPNGLCRGSQDKPGSQTGAGQTPLLAKEPAASTVVNSEIGICNHRGEAPEDLSSPDIKRFLNAGALQDMLWCWYEKEPGSPLLRPVEACSEPDGQLQDQLPVASSPNRITAVDAVAESAGETPACQTIPVLQREEDLFQVPKNEDAPAMPPGDVPRKRVASSSSDDVLSKRVKPSSEPAEGSSPSSGKAQSSLGKVKCFIQNQLEVSMGVLDHGLQHLNERIARTQCLRKHEGIVIKIVKKISRLDRRINAVISFQKTELSRNANQPGADAQSKALTCATLPPGTADGKPALSKKPASAETVSSAVERSAEADELPCVDVLKRGSGVPAARPSAHPVKAAARSPDSPAEKNTFLIDLTDEGNNTSKEGKKSVVGRRHSAHESLPASLLQPARQSPNQVPSRFPHLPPLPSVEPDPEHLKDFRDTLPPQKLELAVAQINQPKGIALQWNVGRVDPRCAPIESFSLFICLEDASSGAISDWRRTSVLKALPLPMACLLSQFPSSARCYFTMQSKDIHGRYGPFCEIQSISAL